MLPAPTSEHPISLETDVVAGVMPPEELCICSCPHSGSQGCRLVEYEQKCHVPLPRLSLKGRGTCSSSLSPRQWLDADVVLSQLGLHTRHGGEEPGPLRTLPSRTALCLVSTSVVSGLCHTQRGLYPNSYPFRTLQAPVTGPARDGTQWSLKYVVDQSSP